MTPASTFAHVRAVLIRGDHRFGDTIASAIGWWIDAGVDGFVDEEPRDWLAAPPKPALAAAPPALARPPEPPAPPEAEALPDSLDALHAFLATGAYAPGAAPAGRRVSPSGDPASDLMIVADMPEQGDAEAGHLFAGDTARLFDAMLAAVGRTRETIYLVPLSPARLPGGRIERSAGEALVALMRRHVALAKPRAVILFGDEAARMLIGEEAIAVRGGLRSLNHGGGTVPAIALFHPRRLRQYPALKAATWTDMRLLPGVLAS